MGNRLERIGCFGAGQIASQGIGRRRRRVSCRLCDRLSGGCREVCRYPGGYCLRGGPWARVAAPALGSGIAVAVHPEAAISIGRWIVLPFAKCGWLNATTVSGSRPRAAIRRSPFMSPDRTRPARTSSRPCADGRSSGSTSRHDIRHSVADPFGCRLDVAVCEMSVAQRHPHIGMAEQARDHRDRHPVHDRMARHGMAQVVQTHILDPGLASDTIPERKVRVAWTGGIEQRGKDEWAACARLPVENGSGLAAERYRPRPRLAVGQAENKSNVL